MFEKGSDPVWETLYEESLKISKKVLIPSSGRIVWLPVRPPTDFIHCHFPRIAGSSVKGEFFSQLTKIVKLKSKRDSFHFIIPSLIYFFQKKFIISLTTQLTGNVASGNIKLYKFYFQIC
jgi:hypothetical protein